MIQEIEKILKLVQKTANKQFLDSVPITVTDTAGRLSDSFSDTVLSKAISLVGVVKPDATNVNDSDVVRYLINENAINDVATDNGMLVPSYEKFEIFGVESINNFAYVSQEAGKSHQMTIFLFR